VAKKTSHSKPISKPPIKIDDYYLKLNRYLFALNSQLSIFQLAYKLEHLFNSSFQRIENYSFIYDEKDPQNTTVFTRRIFTQLGGDNADTDQRATLILFDNKIESKLDVRPKKEKNLNNQTLALFPSDYYLFGNRGIRKFTAGFNTCNYLLLIILKSFSFKEIEGCLNHAVAVKLISKLYAAQKLLQSEAVRKTKAEIFLGAFSLDTEQKITDFLQQKQAQCLRETKCWTGDSLYKLQLSGLDSPLCTIRNEESMRLLQYDESYEYE